DIGALPRVAGIDARAFDADEDEYRDQHRVAYLRDQALFRHADAAEEVLGECRIVEEEDEKQDRRDQRNDLGDGDDLVDVGRLLDAAEDHKMERPDAGEGYQDGDDAGAVPEDIWKEPAERRCDEHPVKGVAEDAADPIAEGRQETDVVAEPRLGIRED